MRNPASESIYCWQRCPPLRFDDAKGLLRVLDQTLLPFRETYRELHDLETSCEAIVAMRVRGAPLVGLCGAFGLALALRDDASESNLNTAVERILATRPTAVNLAWAVNAVDSAVRSFPAPERYSRAVECALGLQQREEASCAAIADHGLTLIRTLRQIRGASDRTLQVLTHCNAGALATGAWGTATAPIYRAAAEGIDLHVWIDETRPRNQGARLTAWELMQSDIPCTLIADNAAGALMQHGQVDFCLVGSDRTTARGDVCNKIGTYQKALAARDNGVPFYVALPCSTIDWQTEDGLADIPIEERDADELLSIDGLDEQGIARRVSIATPGLEARNIAFDVTPARLISGGLLCEMGLFQTGKDGMRRLRERLDNGSTNADPVGR